MRFRRRLLAWSLSAGFGVFLFIGLSGLIVEPYGSGSFLFFVGLTAISLVLMARTFRMETIIVKNDCVLVRGFVRSKRIPVATIRDIEPVKEPNMYGMQGRTLAIRTADGGRVVVGEFWSRIDRSGNAPRVDEVVRQLNAIVDTAKRS